LSQLSSPTKALLNSSGWWGQRWWSVNMNKTNIGKVDVTPERMPMLWLQNRFYF